MNNKLNGNRFEQELAQVLAGHGFWVHVLQQNKAGQPADIIAVKGSYATLIDCKVVSDRNHGFPLSRVEENQWYAMRKFEKCTGNQCWFALRLEDGGVWFIPMHEMESLKTEGKNRIPIGTVMDGSMLMPMCCCDDLEAWIQIAKNGGVPF